MTQDDLDKLKDVTEVRCAIYQREEDGLVYDIHGERWLTGVLNGERVKRRFAISAAQEVKSKARTVEQLYEDAIKKCGEIAMEEGDRPFDCTQEELMMLRDERRNTDIGRHIDTHEMHMGKPMRFCGLVVTVDGKPHTWEA